MEKLVTYLIICTIPEKLLFVSLLNYSGLWLKTQGRKASRRKSGGRKRPATPFTAGGNADRTRICAAFGGYF